MKELLKKVTTDGIDKDLALKIYEESRQPFKSLELYEKAFEIKEKVMGDEVEIIVPSGVILDCKLTPPCSYCNSVPSPKRSKRFETVVKGLPKLQELGVKRLLLVGGTRVEGYDKEILELVKKINEVSDIEIDLNFGCSVSKETVQKLKTMNVTGITSSLEIYNEEIFKKAKPGDSLDGRKKLIEIADKENLDIRSFMMLGLGETDQDRIDHLFYLKQFKNMRNLVFSRFTPRPGTPYGEKMPCPSWEVARTIAIARLIMPEVYLSTSHNSGLADIPLWYIAGGNEFFGMTVVNKKGIKLEVGEEIVDVDDEIGILNKIPMFRHQIEGMGMKLKLKNIKK